MTGVLDRAATVEEAVDQGRPPHRKALLAAAIALGGLSTAAALYGAEVTVAAPTAPMETTVEVVSARVLREEVVRAAEEPTSGVRRRYGLEARSS